MNGANYQRSGTDPLRSNPQDVHATQITPALPSGTPCKGTTNLRAYQATLTAAKLTTPTGGRRTTPSTVDTFPGTGV